MPPTFKKIKLREISAQIQPFSQLLISEPGLFWSTLKLNFFQIFDGQKIRVHHFPGEDWKTDKSVVRLSHHLLQSGVGPDRAATHTQLSPPSPPSSFCTPWSLATSGYSHFNQSFVLKMVWAESGLGFKDMQLLRDPYVWSSHTR